MWRNLKYLHIWHVCDVENASTCVKFMLFCCKIGFVAIYALLSQISFVAIYAVLCGEKMTNIKYARLLACLLASADRQLEIVAVQKGETWKYARYNSMQDINRLFEIVSAGRE